MPRSAPRAHRAPRSTPATSPATPRLPWYRRSFPWSAVVITLLVFVTVPFAVSPIRDAATLRPVEEARLDLSAAYLAITPISNVLDTLTLLTVGQHIAIFLWAVVGFAAWRVLRGRARGTSVVRELIAAGVLLLSIVLTYLAGVVAPRPMAQLTKGDETVLAVDFHAHTMHSHDGRSGWDEEDVRAWQRGAGYDVAYITDHRSFEGGERGIAGNPPQAGEGTMLLQGLEAVYRGEHVNILSAGRRYRGLTTADLRDVEEQSLAMANLIPTTSPILIETVPGNLSRVPATTDSGPPGVSAIEIIDGSPRGLSQGRRERARILRLADSLNLALVTGTDNHGWGRTAPGWTLLRIPGWRGMATDSLSRRIEDIMRIGRRQSTKTVERRVAGASAPIALVFSGVIVPWRMFTTLSADERVMWIVWVWGLVLLGRALRGTRGRLSPSV